MYNCIKLFSFGFQLPDIQHVFIVFLKCFINISMSFCSSSNDGGKDLPFNSRGFLDVSKVNDIWELLANDEEGRIISDTESDADYVPDENASDIEQEPDEIEFNEESDDDKIDNNDTVMVGYRFIAGDLSEWSSEPQNRGQTSSLNVLRKKVVLTPI